MRAPFSHPPMLAASMPLTLADFDYDLPPELIAQHPLPGRSDSRLLHVTGEALIDRTFRALPALLAAGDVVVFNDTRVINARLFGIKASGGRIEILVERVLGPNDVLAHIRASHPPRAGTRMRIAAAFDATVLERHDALYHLRFEGEADAIALLERHGELPLPPYITHTPEAADSARYQTVYARVPGAVAAPTAGLHFDAALLDALKRRGVALAYVTLHVGAGTFQPVRVDDIAQHRMHREWYRVPQDTVDRILTAKSRGARIVSIGTTALRALEAAAQSGTLSAGTGETDLFITPGYRFRVIDRLVTNFHLPRSTLLMLVSAFAGMRPIRNAYRHAIAERYRFFSYGDAMLLERTDPA